VSAEKAEVRKTEEAMRAADVIEFGERLDQAHAEMTEAAAGSSA